MPWFRLDDSFHSHPKVIAAGNEAIGLYVRCGTYAAEHLTDGFIRQDVALLYGSAALADKLVQTGLWRRTRGGWQIPDYLDYNPSKEAVDKERKTNAARQRRWQERRHNAVSNDVSNGATNTAPSRPDPRSGVDVVNRTNRSRADPAEIDQIIITEINHATGRIVTAEWARKICAHILDGRTPADPAAYVRQAIRNDPNPRTRFLPVY